MPGTCHFQDKWLLDERFSPWVRRASVPVMAHCHLCQKDIDISTMGQTALTSHAKGSKHQSKLARKTESMAQCGNISAYMGTQTSTSSTATTSTGNSRTAASSGDTYFNINDQLKAEILLGLNMARSNYSFSSSSDMPFISKSMFPDSNIAQEFTFSETKSMYVLTYGIAPYIDSLQINNIKE